METEGHPLAFPWAFTYFKKVANKSYEENTYNLGTCQSVHGSPSAFASLVPLPRLLGAGL
jgi:hypothetical protein